MHLMDSNHLLTIGYDADDQATSRGSPASSSRSRRERHGRSGARPSLLIGTRGSSSEATTNHLAFKLLPPQDLLALPW